MGLKQRIFIFFTMKMTDSKVIDLNTSENEAVVDDQVQVQDEAKKAPEVRMFYDLDNRSKKANHLSPSEKQYIVETYKSGINHPQYEVSQDSNGKYHIKTRNLPKRHNKYKSEYEEEFRQRLSNQMNVQHQLTNDQLILTQLMNHQRELDILQAKYDNLHRKHRKLKRNIFGDEDEIFEPEKETNNNTTPRTEDDERTDNQDVQAQLRQQQANIQQQLQSAEDEIERPQQQPPQPPQPQLYIRPQANWRQSLIKKRYNN